MSKGKYSASMVSCLFWLQETWKTAELMEQGVTLADIRTQAIAENIYQVRATDRARRIAGVCHKRLSALSDELRSLFITTDIKTAKLILLLAIMKTDLLFFEFMHTSVKQAIVLGEKSIAESATTMFFNRKIEESPEVTAFSESAIAKLKQTYIKYLVEADILSSVAERTIQPIMIDYRLQDAVARANMMPYLVTLTGGTDDV